MLISLFLLLTFLAWADVAIGLRRLQRPNPAGAAECLPLSLNGDRETAKNIVLAPSAFLNASLAPWPHLAQWLAGTLEAYPPYQAGSIPSLNIWALSSGVSGDVGEECWFNQWSPRLLYCHVDKFRAHAEDICGTGLDMSVLIVHNSRQYGGAAYFTKDAATMSMHEDSPALAAHELAHIMFGLGDEYEDGRSSADRPNCDLEGCAKWIDLWKVAEGKFLGEQVECSPGCAGGRYFAPSQHTIMRHLGAPFGLVNERITCCRYLLYADRHGLPGYCEKFYKLSLDLTAYCAIGVPERFWAGYVHLERPVLWYLKKDALHWHCMRVMALKSGQYQRWMHEGEDAVQVQELPGSIRVRITAADGDLLKEMWFSDKDEVHGPPGEDKDQSSMRTRIKLVLHEGEHCHVGVQLKL